ncbi:MAG: hypothetical protein EOO92_14410, partial [Pedobacter sp.]
MKKLFVNSFLILSVVFYTACKKGPTVDPVTPPPVVPPTGPGVKIDYLKLAQETHTFTTNNLLTASYGYRANTTNHANNCYEWYNVS